MKRTYFAGLPKGWTIERFVKVVNDAIDKRLGSTTPLFNDLPEECVMNELNEGVERESFEVMAVEFDDYRGK